MATRRTRQRGFPGPGPQSAPPPLAWLPYFDWAERARFRVGLHITHGRSADRPQATAEAALAGGKADWQVERDRHLAASAARTGDDRSPCGRPVGSAVDVSWSYSDHRRGTAEIQILARDSAIGIGGEAAYVYRPNLLFFGIGPETSSDRRSIYLAEEGRGDLFLRIGSQPLMGLRLGAGISHIAVRGGAGVPSIEEEFTPTDQVPFMGQSTTVVRYGASAVLGRVHGRLERTQPASRGFEVRGEGWLYEDLDGSALEWTEWKGEARAYVPVFADRRVLALRGLYASANPGADSPALPFYRLPESAGDLLFRAFESGRFRDRQLVLGDIEYRWWLWEWLWAVGFAQLGWVAPSSDALRFDQVRESYGGGIRAAVTSTLLYRLDIAHGSEGTQTDFRFGAQFRSPPRCRVRTATGGMVPACLRPARAHHRTPDRRRGRHAGCAPRRSGDIRRP